MSSVVNKSSTRFAPKATTRGAVRKQPRRLSVTSNNTPGLGAVAGLSRGSSTVGSKIPEEVAELRKEAHNFGITQRTSSSRDEAAIEDDDGPHILGSRAKSVETSTSGAHSTAVEDKMPPPSNRNSLRRGVSTEVPLRSRTVPTPARLTSLSDVRGSVAMNPLMPRTMRHLGAGSGDGTTDIFVPQGSTQETSKHVKKRDPNVMNPGDIPRTRKGHRTLVVPHGEKRVIEEDTFTMADLCKDIPIGMVNDDYWNFEEARKKRKIQRERILQEKRMWKEIMNDPEQNDAVREAAKQEWLNLQKLDKERRGHMESARRELNERARAEERIRASVVQENGLKMRLSADGVIALDDSSQFVETHKEDDGNDSRVREEVNKYDSFTNSASYTTRERSERWDDTETAEFYKAVSMWGTDFNLIAHMFPGRSRRQIKTKFKQEEKQRPELMALAILRKLPIDLDLYSKQTGKKLFTQEEVEGDLNQVRIRHEKQLEMEDVSRRKAAQEDRERAQAEDARRFGRDVKNQEEQDVEIVGDLDDIKREAEAS